jgi:hypothetical protein
MRQLAKPGGDSGRDVVRSVAADVQPANGRLRPRRAKRLCGVFDAYVANRRGRVSKEEFCAFQASIAQRHATEGVSADPRVRNQWVVFFTDQRAKALSWRSTVDPTLRSG